MPLLVLAAALAGEACRPLPVCHSHADCAGSAQCIGGSCLSDDQAAGEGEGEGDGGPSVDVQVVVRGVDAGEGVRVALPLELDAANIALDPVGVHDCDVEVEEIALDASWPVTLWLQCARLHLGELTLPLSLSLDDEELAVSLRVRFVPSDWIDLQRTMRELITVDAAGALYGAPVPAGAPVFVPGDRLPSGALAASPRVLAEQGGVATDVPFEADGEGMWFALPASARVWLYYAPTTGAAPLTETATPWSAFTGVWHLDNDAGAVADAALDDGANDLAGQATPTAGAVGGAAHFDGGEGLFAELAHAPTSGAISAWMLLDGNTEDDYQAAVSVGSDLAEGAFDPEAVALYADYGEQACGHLGTGDGEDSTQRCSTVSPAAMSDGAWHHVAWRWQGAERELIVDGVGFDATGPAPSSFGLEVLSIGSAIDGDFPWVGAIDEVRMAKSALPTTWFMVEHASVADLTTSSGRPFVQGLRPDLVVDSEVVSSQGEPLPPLPVVPAMARGVLIAFVAARGAPASGAGFDDVTMARLAPSAVGSDLSLTALSWEGALDGAALSVTHEGQAPEQAVIGTVAFPGGTAGGHAGVELAMAPVVAEGPRLAMAAAGQSMPAAWILVAVASRRGVVRCDACGRHALGPIEGGAGLVLDVYVGEREPAAHVLEPVTMDDDPAAVVVVRVGP
ncbi:MAG: LamG domain-containing protein [Deltaproteobacteria bacterium]|nr:LamG domain-containing protein [Deltaproteobacteria bacterium]